MQRPVRQREPQINSAVIVFLIIMPFFSGCHTGELGRIPLLGTSVNKGMKKGRGFLPPPQRCERLTIRGSLQRCADVNKLAFALQWLNEFTLRVKHEAEVPDCYDSARLGVDKEIPTPCHRHHVAVRQSSLLERTGNVERCLVERCLFVIIEIRHGDIEVGRGENKDISRPVYCFRFAAEVELEREVAAAGVVARIYDDGIAADIGGCYSIYISCQHRRRSYCQRQESDEGYHYGPSHLILQFLVATSL